MCSISAILISLVVTVAMMISIKPKTGQKSAMIVIFAILLSRQGEGWEELVNLEYKKQEI